MSLYSYKNCSPSIGSACFIAPSADVIGNVTVGDSASLWYEVVARGDINKIVIGENTNIQDQCMLHVIEELPLIIGKNVSVGHRAILHACTIGDSCLIGMGAIVLDGAVISENSVVAAGSVVPPGKKYPAGMMIMGAPAKAVRPLSEQELAGYGNHYKSYVHEKEQFLEHVVKL